MGCAGAWLEPPARGHMTWLYVNFVALALLSCWQEFQIARLRRDVERLKADADPTDPVEKDLARLKV